MSQNSDQRTAKLVGGHHDGLVVWVEPEGRDNYAVPPSFPGMGWATYERTGRFDEEGNEIFALVDQGTVPLPETDRARQWRELREAVDDFKATLWDHRRDFFFLWLGMMVGGLAQWMFG